MVNASTLSAGSISLLDIPVDPAFRLTLRVYDLDAASEGRVLVRAWSTNTSVRSPLRPVSTFRARCAHRGTRISADPVLDTDRRFEFAYAQIADIAGLAPSTERIRLEIVPLTSGSRFWAFVSVTNNIAQHVTTITPRP